MKKNIKLIVSLLLLIGAYIMPAYSQQITKFGVVDTEKIYNAYFRDSSAIKAYEAKRNAFEEEIDRLTLELKELNDERKIYKRAGDTDKVAELNKIISQKSQYVTEYAKTKNMELEEMKLALEDDDEFYQKLNSTLARVAESGGYSMILSLQDDKSILWFSSSVDITNDVMKDLGL